MVVTRRIVSLGNMVTVFSVTNGASDKSSFLSSCVSALISSPSLCFMEMDNSMARLWSGWVRDSGTLRMIFILRDMLQLFLRRQLLRSDPNLSSPARAIPAKNKMEDNSSDGCTNNWHHPAPTASSASCTSGRRSIASDSLIGFVCAVRGRCDSSQGAQPARRVRIVGNADRGLWRERGCWSQSRGRYQRCCLNERGSRYGCVCGRIRLITIRRSQVRR